MLRTIAVDGPAACLYFFAEFFGALRGAAGASEASPAPAGPLVRAFARLAGSLGACSIPACMHSTMAHELEDVVNTSTISVAKHKRNTYKNRVSLLAMFLSVLSHS